MPFALLSAAAVGFYDPTLLVWDSHDCACQSDPARPHRPLFMIAFLGEALCYIFVNRHWNGLIPAKPFYDPRTFSVRAIAAAPLWPQLFLRKCKGHADRSLTSSSKPWISLLPCDLPRTGKFIPGGGRYLVAVGAVYVLVKTKAFGHSVTIDFSES